VMIDGLATSQALHVATLMLNTVESLKGFWGIALMISCLWIP
jgi:hypothetical protein